MYCVASSATWTSKTFAWRHSRGLTETRLSLEPDPDVREFVCASCHQQFRRVLGYVMEGSRPLAVYHADLYVDHPHARAAAVLTVSIGDWSESAPPESRRRARLVAEPQGNRVAMTFSDFASDEQLEPQLGTAVSADDARRSGDQQTYLRIADAVVYSDRRVREVLGVTDKLA